LEKEGKRWTPEKSEDTQLPEVVACALKVDLALRESIESLIPNKLSTLKRGF